MSTRHPLRYMYVDIVDVSEGNTEAVRGKMMKGNSTMQSPKKVLLYPLHIRVKRKTATYFVRIENPATVETLRIAAARMMAIPPHQLRLCRMAEDGQAIRFLEDDKHIAELEMRNDDVVCAVLRGDDGWETPCIVDFPNS